MFVLLFFLAFILQCTIAQDYLQPEQVHVSYGGKKQIFLTVKRKNIRFLYGLGNPKSLFVTWVTFDDTANESIIEYGQGKLDKIAFGNQTLFTDGGSLKRKIYIHRVFLTNLEPGQTYSKRDVFACYSFCQVSFQT